MFLLNQLLSFFLFTNIISGSFTAKIRRQEKDYLSSSSQDLITSLPSLPFPLKSRHFSGYLSSLNSTYLFYWFVESQSDPQSDPLLLWLSGGPGCSSLFGSFGEIGPILFDANGTLTSNAYAWNRNANVLFIESPAGTGFSYRTNFTKYDTNDNETALINYHALKSFYSKFPQYTQSPLYLSGQSYAAHYLPRLGAQILEHQFPPTFKGVFLGNGEVFYLLNDFLMKHYMKIKGFDSFSLEPSSKFSRRLWIYDINRECNATTPDPYIYVPETRSPVPPEPSTPCVNHYPLYEYLNRPEVRLAIHVDPNFADDWRLCSAMKPGYLQYDYTYDSTAPHFQVLLRRNITVVLYNGDADTVCSYVTARSFVRKQLKLKTVGPKETLREGNRTYGTMQRYEGNLKLVVFKDASHMVPIDEPKGVLKLLNEELFGR